MQCPKCQTDNPDDSKFCKECAASLAKIKDISFTVTLKAPKMGLSKGTVIADKYRIIEEIGRGGMGVVYKAKDTRLDRIVALKFLSSEYTQDEEAKQRFVQEAKAAAALNHPNISIIHEIDEHQGQTFIAMEHILGQSLKEKLKDGPLDVDEAKDLAIQVAEGLKEAHDKGIIHRDIKPANIMLTEKGRAKITDFGLAKLSGGADLTKASTIMGTVAYMSPEQAKGEEVDHRTDIWSLGAMLYEMLSGGRPFQKPQEQALIYAILNDKPAPLSLIRSEIPNHIEQVIEKTLSKKPSDRFQDIQDLIKDFKSPLSIDLPKPSCSIVVLPFDDMSPNRDNEYFSDGLTEEIITDLSQVRELCVISRNSAMALKGTKKNTKAIGKELNVQYVLEGSVRKAGDKLRITAQLIDATTDIHLWAEKYSGTLEDVFEIQEKVSRSIVDALRIKLSPDEEQQIAEQPIKDFQAYDCYLRARNVMYSRMTAETLAEAERLLRIGLEIIGDNALLYATLGHVYFQAVRIWAKEESELSLAEQYSNKALSLDPSLSQAYMVLAFVQLWLKSNFKEFAHLIKRALSLDPDDFETIMWGFWLFILSGRTSKAVELANHMIKLNPLDSLVPAHLAHTYAYEGKFDDAIDRLRQILPLAEIYPPWAVFWLSYYLVCVGRPDEALEITETLEQVKTWDLYVQFSRFLRFVVKGDSLRAEEMMTDAFRTATRRDCVVSCMIADLYVLLDNQDQALEWLEHAVNRGFINYPYLNKHDPLLENIRGEPRFKKLMERVKHEWENFEV